MSLSEVTLSVMDGENQIFDEFTELDSLKIFESINSIPYFIMNIHTVKPESLYNLKELTIRVDTRESIHTYQGCITKGTLGTGGNIIFGYLVPFNSLMKRSSAFLGNNITTAISSLNLRDKIVGLKEVNGEFYQINETKTEAFLRLMLTAESQTVFGLTKDSVVSFRLDDITNPFDVAIGSQSVNLEFRRFHSFENDTNVSNFSQTNNNLNWRNVNYPILPERSIVSPEMAFNLINNRKLTNEINILLDKSFNYYVPFQLGDTIKVIDLTLPTQYFKVIQREVEFMEHDLIVNLKLAAEGVW